MSKLISSFIEVLDIAAGFHPGEETTPENKYLLVELSALYLFANGLINERTCEAICTSVEEETGLGDFNEGETVYINRDAYVQMIKEAKTKRCAKDEKRKTG